MHYEPVDWENSKAIAKLLRTFADAVTCLQGGEFIANSMMPMLRTMLHAFIVEKACDVDLPPHVRAAADAMFDYFGDRFETPTDAQMIAQVIAAVCDPRTCKGMNWLEAADDDAEVEEKVYRRLTIEAKPWSNCKFVAKVRA